MAAYVISMHQISISRTRKVVNLPKSMYYYRNRKDNSETIAILHYFDNKSTNASAESFNAKLKAFRSIFRGVRDTQFFLYRVMKLYA